MISIITGDIVNSRTEKSAKWQLQLKKILNLYGKEPRNWEVYRGDSLQLRTTPAKAFLAAMHIKSGMRQLAGLDVRMAIGIGDIERNAKKITESTGSAFIRSGESFDLLKKQMMLLST